MKDLLNITQAAILKVSAAVADTAVTKYVDLLGYEGAEVLLDVGVNTGVGNLTVTLEASDTTTDGDFATVASGDTQGGPLVLSGTSGHNTALFRLGFIGSENKRYLRVHFTKSGTVSFPIAVYAVLGYPVNVPAMTAPTTGTA